MKIYLFKDGHQYGPLSLDEVNAKVLSGEIHAAHAAWIAEWSEWRRVSDIPGIRPVPPPFDHMVVAPNAPRTPKPLSRAVTIIALCSVSVLVSLFMNLVGVSGAQSVPFIIGSIIGNALVYLIFAIPASLLVRGSQSLVVGLAVIGFLAASQAYGRFFIH